MSVVVDDADSGRRMMLLLVKNTLLPHLLVLLL